MIRKIILRLGQQHSFLPQFPINSWPLTPSGCTLQGGSSVQLSVFRVLNGWGLNYGPIVDVSAGQATVRVQCMRGSYSSLNPNHHHTVTIHSSFPFNSYEKTIPLPYLGAFC